MTQPSLAGQRAIIAGATGGLGLAIARSLGQAGARLAICGRDEHSLATACDGLRSAGIEVTGSALDVTRPDALIPWLDQAVAQMGGVDVFIPNAAANPGPHHWEQGFGAVLFYIAEACDRLKDHLAASGGSVVVISSAAASMRQAGFDQRVYGSAKAALAHFAGQLAHDWGPAGVRVNTVSPGPIMGNDGYWSDLALSRPELVDRLQSQSSLGRLVSPEEVAQAVLFLAGPAASGITGANLRVDAGLLGHTDF